jgi:hypothetical protein
MKVNLHKSNIVIVIIYRSPSGNYNYFLRKVELFLKSLSTKKTEYIICGDINIDYLQNHSRKQHLDLLLATYNLKSIVNFPTSIVNGSGTATDNFFIDLSLKYTIRPLINGLSDHDAQLLVLKNIKMPSHKTTLYCIRDFNEHSMQEFLIHLSIENWENVFEGNSIDTTFNKFLDTYLKIVNMCFKQTNKQTKKSHAEL